MEELIRTYQKLFQESDNKAELLDELYREYKMRSPEYFDGKEFDLYWSIYFDRLCSFVRDMPLEYIIDASVANYEKPLLDSKKINCNNAGNYDIEDVLDYLVYCGRCKISDGGNIESFDSMDIEGQCKKTSKNVDKMASKLQLKHQLVRIDPGFTCDNLLFNGYGFHYYNLIESNNQEYLIDISYKQFFKKNRCSLERLGMPFYFPPFAGTFMAMDEKRRKVAETLLKRGWIKLTDEIYKAYLDGFTMSYRNGIYYEEKGEVVYETDYTIDDYRNFLAGIDNQVNHEGKHVLGYQLRPLKNPEMRFKQ